MIALLRDKVVLIQLLKLPLPYSTHLNPKQKVQYPLVLALGFIVDNLTHFLVIMVMLKHSTQIAFAVKRYPQLMATSLAD